MEQESLLCVHRRHNPLWASGFVRLHSPLCVYNNVVACDGENVNNDLPFFDISINRSLTDF